MTVKWNEEGYNCKTDCKHCSWEDELCRKDDEFINGQLVDLDVSGLEVCPLYEKE